MRSFTRILNNTCLCSRYNDDSTKKIVVWIPFAGYNSTGYNGLLSFAYLHYVVPLYQPYEGDFYYGLSKNNGKLDGLIADAANSTSDSIVKTLWSKLCGMLFISTEIRFHRTSDCLVGTQDRSSLLPLMFRERPYVISV
ncbi:unnamed protein product [Haemonchus placei]|uniref:ANF_receptor domain-containing protein n=1 Tax=Haemonchus placei TaxID=6290 RepID=A0A0N4WNE3_HAEPC|nr:unnamed protein product [Haemonchus placei]